MLCCVPQLCTVIYTDTYEELLTMNVGLDLGLAFCVLFLV